MPKLSCPSPRIISQKLFFISVVAFCEGSATYPFLIAPKLFGNAMSSKSLPHAKIQLYLPSQSSSAIFQTFCQTGAIVKEVLAMVIQMS